MQKKLHSLAEANVNLIVGYPITWAIYAYLIPWIFHVRIEAKQAFGFIVLFSASSLIRQYVVRRIFNAMERR
jgi:hypothetical protein